MARARTRREASTALAVAAAALAQAAQSGDEGTKLLGGGLVGNLVTVSPQ
jgi:hypothetical protein